MIVIDAVPNCLQLIKGCINIEGNRVYLDNWFI